MSSEVPRRSEVVVGENVPPPFAFDPKGDGLLWDALVVLIGFIVSVTHIGDGGCSKQNRAQNAGVEQPSIELSIEWFGCPEAATHSSLGVQIPSSINAWTCVWK